MRRYNSVLITLCFVLYGILLFTSSPITQATPLSGEYHLNVAQSVSFTIAGQVTHNSTPMPNVHVTISNGLSTTTNASGLYTFTNLITNSYTITPFLFGHNFSPNKRTVSVPPSQSGQNFTAAFNTHTISGRVTKSGGTSLANVLLASSNGLTTTTNASGFYTFTSLLSGTYTLTPNLIGYTFSPANRTANVPPHHTGINFVGSLNVYLPMIFKVVGPCSCLADLYNCPDFSTHSQAQACFNFCISIGSGDIHRLDPDNDGDACESLP